MTKYIRSITILTGICLSVFHIQAQVWSVPEDQAKKVSPFKFDAQTTKKGDDLFHKNCISCHGEPTKGNYAALTPIPGDPASDKFQKQTDGALYFKITTGRSPMPEFKNVLTEEERWLVISYFRSFNKTYTQPEPITAPAGMYGGMDITLKLQMVTDQKKIMVMAIGTKNGISIPVAGVEMFLYAKRYFGNLQIDEKKTTGVSGEAYFDYQESIPGDSAGNVTFLVKLNADGLSGFKMETIMKVGKPTSKPSLIDTRAMWTVRMQAPIWLIASYSLVVLGVWSVLAYIIFQIAKIRKLGKKSSSEETQIEQ